MGPIARALVVSGLILVALGLILTLVPSIPLLGRLPGDIRIERPGLRLYVPITSCVLASAVASGVLWLLSQVRP